MPFPEAVAASVGGDKLHVVEDACRVPVVVSEDTLSRWRALKQCLTAQTGLMFTRCPAPATDILKHCSRLVPCILAIEESTIDQLDSTRFMQTVDFGRSVLVLVRVAREDDETVDRLMRLGCMGFVGERASAAAIGEAIRALGKGEIWANRRFLAEFIRGLLSAQSPRNLTARENEILNLISKGRSNREIADQLFISRETVRWHIRTLYAKIGVHDRVQAVRHGANLNNETQLLFGFNQPR